MKNYRALYSFSKQASEDNTEYRPVIKSGPLAGAKIKFSKNIKNAGVLNMNGQKYRIIPNADGTLHSEKISEDNGESKTAAAVLTPEAEQAAMQQGGAMDPSMAGGDPSMMGGQPPMDPSMMGGQPPMDPSMAGGQPQMDTTMMGGASGPNGGQIPPEILQDQMFLQFLQETMGITYDPTQGMFIDPQGQPISAEAIIQAYSAFQQQVMQMQQGQMGGQPPMDPSMAGGQPPMDPTMMGGQPPMDPSMMGGQQPMGPSMGQPPMDPSMMGGITEQGAPMDPSMMGGGMDPSMAGGQPPMDPSQGAPSPDEMMNQLASVVMSGVESVLQDYTATIEKKLSTLLSKIESLDKSISALQSTTDKRDQMDKDEDQALRAEIAADLQPTVKTAAEHKKQNQQVNLFNIIQGKLV